MTSTQTSRFSALLPWLAVVAAVVMLLTQALAWFGVERAAEAATQGEAQLLLDTISAQLNARVAQEQPVDLAELMTQHESAGLRYISLRAGRTQDQLGTAELPPLSRGQTWTHRGDRVRSERRLRGITRVRAGRGNMSPGSATEPRWEHVRPGEQRRMRRLGRGGPGGGGPPILSIELDAKLGPSLRASALRTLVMASVGALLFLLLGWAYWRAQRQREAARQSAADSKKLAALGEMSAVMAHELRNPLTSLKGHAQLLVRALPEGKERTKAERVVKEAKRLEELSTNLLEFVRSGRLQTEAQSIAGLVQDAIGDVGVEQVTLRSEAPELHVDVDAARIHQVLVNVMTNAVEASDQDQGDRSVEVVVAKQGSQALVRVLDRGAGIVPGHEERIFEPFHTTRTQGTGLGLSIARKIAEAHGGSVRAMQREGGGAEVVITLPVSKATSASSSR